jgi:hypothetical protein
VVVSPVVVVVVVVAAAAPGSAMLDLIPSAACPGIGHQIP